MAAYGWILPQLPDDARYAQFLKAGEFRLQRCTGCRAFRSPARWICPHCGSEDYAWEQPQPSGTVTSVSWFFQDLVLKSTGDEGRRPSLPYSVVVVRLDDGPFLMARAEGVKFGELAVGDRVTAVIAKALLADEPRIVFTPVIGSA
ncbi:MAG: zinc ribbon domain-containing protein [Burkholderiaceae bacterium]|nr:zinc ribbon domain-containing protein [Burkholderiaceae bacterium]